MRVIKFRAWNIKSKNWIKCGYGTNEFEISSNGKHISVSHPSNHNDRIERFCIGDVELMQFTGLTDKNGVDIYEGDIVSFLGEYENEPNREILFDVDFLTYTILSKQEKEWVDSGSNHYKYCHQEGNTDLYFLNDLSSYELEVIGNIHENPELIGG